MFLLIAEEVKPIPLRQRRFRIAALIAPECFLVQIDYPRPLAEEAVRGKFKIIPQSQSAFATSNQFQNTGPDRVRKLRMLLFPIFNMDNLSVFFRGDPAALRTFMPLSTRNFAISLPLRE